MKAIIVFNQLNDIVFVHYDKGFLRYVNEKWTAQDETSRPSDDAEPSKLDPNILMQMFSPLISSQRFMTEEARNPYQSIKCSNNFHFVLEQYHDIILMAICGDGQESEEFMRRKLFVLQRISRFLFGPCDEEIKPDSTLGRELRWHFISKLLDTWVELYQNEQSFLIEAIERLNVNQLLNVKCIELMEMTLSALKSPSGDSGVLHAFTIVNCKLLSLFSVRNAFELLPSDLLLIILLVKTRFRQNHKLGDFFSQSLPLSGNTSSTMPSQSETEHYQSAPEDSEVEEEVYSSVPSTPAGESEIDFLLGNGDTEPERDNDNEKPEKHKYQLSDEELLKSVYPPVNDPSDGHDHQVFTAMLGTPNCKYSPHTLHCMEVMPGIVVVVIAEAKYAKYSGPMCQTISIIRALLHQVKGNSLQGRQTIEYLEQNIRKILELGKKLKVAANIGKLLADIRSKWDQCKAHGLAKHLDNIEENQLAGRLSGALSTIIDKLKILFRIVYLPNATAPHGVARFSEAINYCQQMIRHNLYDYKDYLAVKAQRNITMTNFVEDFPGLVHFIYVDRSLSQMTAPSINVSTDSNPHRIDMMTVIKKKIWEKIVDIQSSLKKGHLTQIFREGDFLFTYFLWFEDGTVQPLQHQRTCERVTDNILPGLLAGGFYRHIIRQIFPGTQHHNIRAYELFMMHVGVVPTQYALRHGRKLASKMWETTGQANSPINLL